MGNGCGGTALFLPLADAPLHLELTINFYNRKYAPRTFYCHGLRRSPVGSRQVYVNGGFPGTLRTSSNGRNKAVPPRTFSTLPLRQFYAATDPQQNFHSQDIPKLFQPRKGPPHCPPQGLLPCRLCRKKETKKKINKKRRATKEKCNKRNCNKHKRCCQNVGQGCWLHSKDIVLVSRKINHLRRLGAKPLLSGLVAVNDYLQGNDLSLERSQQPCPAALAKQKYSRKEVKLSGRIRPVQVYFEQLYRTISGSEGFTLTWLIRKSGLKSWNGRWRRLIFGMIRNVLRR